MKNTDKKNHRNREPKLENRIHTESDNIKKKILKIKEILNKY